MDSSEIIFTDAGILAAMIRSGELSSVEVATAFIEQIRLHNGKYNAVVTYDPDLVLQEARKADQEIRDGKMRGKLHGLPVTIKDNFRTRGIRTTAGFTPLRKYIPKEDAVAVKLLKAEGAIILGKTNLATLALDVQSRNKVFGKTRNPWDITRTPGGSSGGCATALATGMTTLSIGNDLAGSIRIPASFCGIYGFMPTFGTTPLKGIIADPYETNGSVRTLAGTGPLARSIDDLVLAMDIIANTSEQTKRMIPLSRESGVKDISKLRIAWTDTFGGVNVDDEIRQKLKDYVDKLKVAGATVTKAIPDIDFYEAWKIWGRIAGMQGGYIIPNIIRFFGSKMVYPLVKNVPMHQDISKPLSLRGYMDSLGRQDKIINAMEKFMDNYDAFLCPVTAVPAFPHHKENFRIIVFNIYNKPLKSNGEDIHYYVATQGLTTPFNLTESPVLAMPIGLSNQGLPIGIQVIGKRFRDFSLLATGKTLDKYRERFNFPLQNREL